MDNKSKVEGDVTEFKVDTGADVTVIPECVCSREMESCPTRETLEI